MQLFWKVQQRIILNIPAILLLFSIYATAQENDTSASVVTGEEVSSEKMTSEEVTSEELAVEEAASEAAVVEEAANEEEKENLFGASLDLGYVGPDVWAGFRVSQGPRIQPLLKFSIHPDYNSFPAYLIPNNIGIAWNIYGSEKDRMYNTKPPPEYLFGEYAKGLGMCDEVHFFIDWSHEWGIVSNNISFWYMAYAWKNNRFGFLQDSVSTCVWFGNSSSGSLEISPSVNLGPFSIYTVQWVVIVGKDREVFENKKYITRNPMGEYRGVFGVSFSKSPVEQYSFDLGVFTEWANRKFLWEWVGGDIRRLGKEPWGIYHVTFTAGANYDIIPQMSIYGNFSVEYITNYWIRLNEVKSIKGCIPYARLGMSYTFGWYPKK